MNSDGLKSIVRTVVPRPVRNWLRAPQKSMEWLWDSGRFAMGFRNTLKLQPDWSLVCHPSAYKVAYEAQLKDPAQALEFQNFLSNCKPGMTLFDLGAHFGIFSLAAAHFEGRSIAVDPSPEAIGMINIQAKLNSCAHRIRTIRAAASDSAEGIDMLAAGVLSDHYFVVSPGRSRGELTHLETITVDGMTQAFGMPTHIKIDVEGHETAVLRGARTTLKGSMSILFVEIHNEIVASGGGDPNAALNELAGMGYAIFGLDGEPASKEVIFRSAITRIVAKSAG